MDHNHGDHDGGDSGKSCPMIMVLNIYFTDVALASNCFIVGSFILAFYYVKYVLSLNEISFHAGHCERILWPGWVANTVVEFVFSALAIFVVAFLYEALKFVREYYLRKAVRIEAERMALEIQSRTSTGGEAGCGGCLNTPLADIREKTYCERITGSTHLMQTLFNLVQIVISYLLMLVFMTFNYWLCLAVVLGLGVGYFFFGWIKQDAYESECCH